MSTLRVTTVVGALLLAAAGAGYFAAGGFDGRSGAVTQAVHGAEPAEIDVEEWPQGVARRQEISTLADILNLPTDFTQTTALYQLAARVDEAGVERLLTEVAELERLSDREAATSILYSRYADLDPAAALDHAINSGTPQIERAISAIFYAWARVDRDQASERLLELTARYRSMAGYALIKALDDLAPGERRRVAVELGIEKALEQVLWNSTSARVAEDPLAAWADALVAVEQQKNPQRLFQVAYAWAAIDPRSALDAAATLVNVGQRTAMEFAILQVWSEQAPEEALVWVLDQTALAARRQQLSTAYQKLAAINPETALLYFQSMGRRDQLAGLDGLMEGWMSADPVAAATWWASLEGRDSHAYLGQRLGHQLARIDVDQALTFASSLDDQRASAVLRGVVETVAAEDPESAALLISRLDSARMQHELSVALAGQWARSDPQAAARWVDETVAQGGDATVLRPSLMRSLLNGWAQVDVEAAARFAERRPQGEQRDEAVLAILHYSLAYADVTDRLFQQISSPDARRQASEILVSNLAASDPDRAERYRRAQ